MEEEQFYKESMDALQKEQKKLQKRISQIYEDKLDGIIDEKMYLEKIREYKEKQTEGIKAMESHQKADHNFYVTANIVLKLAAQARKLFESSEVEEKRQLLWLVFQKLKLNDVTLSIQVHNPFQQMVDYKLSTKNWKSLDVFRTIDWYKLETKIGICLRKEVIF